MTDNDAPVGTKDNPITLPANDDPIWQSRGITAEQYATLMKPLNPKRVSKRSQGGKQLSYVEAYDIKAHLTRIFGFGNWDCEILEYNHVAERPYTNSSGNDAIEVIYSCRVRLTIRDPFGHRLCRHAEAAVGSASGPLNLTGDLHDNALKTAESDALKRCAINMGSQFGLSLYNNGSLAEVIVGTKVLPPGVEPPQPVQPTDEQTKLLETSLGAEQISETPA